MRVTLFEGEFAGPSTTDRPCPTPGTVMASKPVPLVMMEEAALKAEHVIRNYDPCISCATHFLKLKMDRR